MPELILASSSLRRQQMLKDLSVSFNIDIPDVDETPLRGEQPLDYVKRVTQAKVEFVAAKHPSKVVLAADTAVIVGRRILGKPVDERDAREMLKLLSGRRQKVITAVSLINEVGEHVQKVVETQVKFKVLTNKDIEKHLADPKNWQGMSGAWGIQSTMGNALMAWIQGSYSSVVGLPVVETINLLRRANIHV